MVLLFIFSIVWLSHTRGHIMDHTNIQQICFIQCVSTHQTTHTHTQASKQQTSNTTSTSSHNTTQENITYEKHRTIDPSTMSSFSVFVCVFRWFACMVLSCPSYHIITYRIISYHIISYHL